MLLNQSIRSDLYPRDQGATHSTSPAINAGLDIDMPDNSHFSQATIKAAIAAGNVSEAQVHDSCMRIMSQWYKIPLDLRYPCGGGTCIHDNVSTPAHKNLARKLSAMSTVLLKNDGDLLPLKKTMRVALIGADAANGSYTAGQGSGGVQNSNVAVSPLTAMQALGISVTYDSGATIAGAVKAASAADVAIIFGSAHSGEGHDRTDLLFSNRTGTERLERIIAEVANAQKKTVVVAAVPGQILTDWRENVASILVPFLPGEQYGKQWHRTDPQWQTLQKYADHICIITNDLSLHMSKHSLRTDPRHVMIGNAIADIIFGAVPPQAKLPLTFPNKDNEQGMTPAQWPGLPSSEFPGHYDAHYTEGMIVGYRWYDKHGVKPAFPFGAGLTYGSSTYSDLKIVNSGKDAWTVSFNIATTGGCDTPQLYLGYPGAATDPAVPTKVLRGFKKSCHSVSPREQISFALEARAMSEWNLATKAWQVVPGKFAVYVGASSQDIRLKGSFIVE